MCIAEHSHATYFSFSKPSFLLANKFEIGIYEKKSYNCSLQLACGRLLNELKWIKLELLFSFHGSYGVRRQEKKLQKKLIGFQFVLLPFSSNVHSTLCMDMLFYRQRACEKNSSMQKKIHTRGRYEEIHNK